MFGPIGLPPATYRSPGSLWFSFLYDSLTAIAYFLLPLVLLLMIRRRKQIRLKLVYLCFAVFIVGREAIDVVALGQPISRMSGILTASLAAIIMASVVLLVRMNPGTLATPEGLSGHGYREAFEAAPDAILQVDETGTIVLANRMAARIFGYSHEELLGSNVDLLIPNASRAAHRGQRDRFVQTRATRPMGTQLGDLHGLRKDGTEFPAEIGLNPVKTGTGIHVTAVIRDVTQRKRMERELEAERAQRYQRTRIMARLSSSLAHEIRNPLAIIHARASDLAERAAEGEVGRAQIANACASIVETSERATRILRGVSALGGAETQDATGPANLTEVVQRALSTSRGRFATQGIPLDSVLPPGLPAVQCRDGQIAQVLVNLLNNAFDAVAGDPRSERWVRVEASTHSGAQYPDGIERVMIDVVDSGPGIAAEHKERLMQPFFTTKAAGAGIGIGLTVSRAIAEDHGGQLDFLELDGHTCFRLTLPVKRTDAEENAG